MGAESRGGRGAIGGVRRVVVGGEGRRITGDDIVGKAGPGLDNGVNVGEGSVGKKKVGERLTEGRGSGIV